MKEALVFIVFPRPCKVAGCRRRSGAPAAPRPPPPTYRWWGVGRGGGGENRAGSKRACRPRPLGACGVGEGREKAEGTLPSRNRPQPPRRGFSAVFLRLSGGKPQKTTKTALGGWVGDRLCTNKPCFRLWGARCVGAPLLFLLIPPGCKTKARRTNKCASC